MDKSIRYQNLVAKFKTHKFIDTELINPHQIEGFNFDVINPWELWHNNLNAKIMFIGQDFSDTNSLEYNLRNDWSKEKKSPTNETLIFLFNALGYYFTEVDYVNKTKFPLFFTNAILGIKKSEVANMSKPVKQGWWTESKEYITELIDIVQPQYIITMGKVAYKAVCNIYNIKTQNNIIGEPIELPDGKTLFAVQHCSPLGQINRNLKTHIQDWLRIRSIIDPHS